MSTMTDVTDQAGTQAIIEGYAYAESFGAGYGKYDIPADLAYDPSWFATD